MVVNSKTYREYIPQTEELLANLAPHAPHEDWDLHGPVADAFLWPFVVVYGTAGTAEQTAALKDQAQRFAREWDDFADGTPRILTDREYVAGPRQAEPILLGTPTTNLVVAEHARELPLHIGNHKYQVGKRVYAGPTLGLAVRFKGLVIFAGEYWGSLLPVNHKWDELPDYIVYDTSRQEYDGTDQHLCAGLFDENWRINPKLQG